MKTLHQNSSDGIHRVGHGNFKERPLLFRNEYFASSSLKNGSSVTRMQVPAETSISGSIVRNELASPDGSGKAPGSLRQAAIFNKAFLTMD